LATLGYLEVSARLEREGKLSSAGSLADLVMRPAGTTADNAR